MSYQSIQFLLFAAGLVVLYYLVGAKQQKHILLLGNTIFYISYGVEYIPFILITLFITYWVGRKMGTIYAAADEKIKASTDKQEKKLLREAAKAHAKKVLLVALIIAIGLLVFCKCSKWGINALNKLLAQWDQQFTLFSVIMPLGISYYTFMAVGYVLDVYWKRIKAETDLVTYAVFLSYFPHVVQGPIDRYKTFRPQISNGAQFNYQNLTFGAQLMLWGFFKKMVIADRLSILVNTVFSNYTDYSGSIFLFAGICSALHIYTDFSGCMDIVRGYSQMLGIEIAKNFDRPFFSKSAAEFWRRWHITLGAWFKDYIYMPLAVSPRIIKFAQKIKERFGTRLGMAVTTIIPTAVVWVLTGLWHGTGWGYIVWGVYWGSLIIISSIFGPEIKKVTNALHINTESESWNVFRMVRTFFIFVIGRLFTVPSRFLISLDVVKTILFDFKVGYLFDGTLFTLGLSEAEFSLIFVCVLILWAVSMLQEKGSVRERIANYNIVFRWGIYYALFFVILIFGMYGPGFEASAFVYGNY